MGPGKVAQVVTKSGFQHVLGASMAAWKTPRQWCGSNSFYSILRVGQVSCAAAQVSSHIPGQDGAWFGPVPVVFSGFQLIYLDRAIR